MSYRLLTILTLTIALFAAGCGDDDSSEKTSTKSTATTSSTATETTSTETTPTEPATSATDCSAGANPVQVADEAGLPAPVAETRRRILEAATTCDYDALQAIVDENPDGFAFQLGAGATDQSATDYWKSIDGKEQVIATLAQLLSTPSAVLTEGTLKTHVWPAVHAGKRTDADWQALIDSGAFTEQEVAAMRKDDMYYGPRVGILPDGTWTYFVSGD